MSAFAARNAMGKVLFIHQNFPAQYKHLAIALKAAGWDVLALTDSGNGQPHIVPTLRYAFDPKSAGSPSAIGADYAMRAQRGATVARACKQMRDKGYVPDVIVGHFGWGETLFVKDVWPSARLLVYAEFYYSAHGADIGFDPEFPSRDPFGAAVRSTARNAALSAALLVADRAQSPTRWQRSRFPKAMQEGIEVIFDGIDSDALTPDAQARFALPEAGITLTAEDEVVSFVNRNLEPYRGYHTFMRSLPKLLALRPKAHVVIVGGAGVSYGRAAPDGQSWKEIFLREVADRIDLARVHFVGRVPYVKLLDLLRVSRAHVYLTYPFVLSWSMLEAMSLGALVIGSRTAPVEEVIVDGQNGLLCDFFDADALAERAAEALGDAGAYAEIRRAARQTIKARYDLRSVCLPQQLQLVRTLAAMSRS